MKIVSILILNFSIVGFCCISCSNNPMGGNKAPKFLSSPNLIADHNREYSYTIEVSDPDGDSLQFTVQHPDWIQFDESNTTFTGLASWSNLGFHQIRITVSDGVASTQQVFSIEVKVGEIICDAKFGSPGLSKYILPFPVGKTYSVIQSYCPPNPAWGHHDWFAYDFDSATGDTIIAARAGRVIATMGMHEDGNRQPGSENYVFILHDDGTVASYVHLTKNGPLVDVNENVAQGQAIALSGDSGNSGGPHLHFAVFRQRGPYDRQYTLPINFKNVQGDLDQNNGLIFRGSYTALPF